MQTLQHGQVEEEEAGCSGAEKITQEPRQRGSCTKMEGALAQLSLVCFTVAVDSIPGESGRKGEPSCQCCLIDTRSSWVMKSSMSDRSKAYQPLFRSLR